MIVYVESNFLLELAFEQECGVDCEAIPQLAESGRITLVLPAFSVGECLEKLGRRKTQRLTIQKSLKEDLRELGRSKSRAALFDQLHNAVEAMIAAAEE